jgi:hypothetical protein
VITSKEQSPCRDPLARSPQRLRDSGETLRKTQTAIGEAGADSIVVVLQGLPVTSLQKRVQRAAQGGETDVTMTRPKINHRSAAKCVESDPKGRLHTRAEGL